MKRLLALVRNYLKAGGFFWPGFLILLVSIIIVTNYHSASWLSGWDTLHPEFNFSLNFQRLIFGVFRPEQGLGAVAAHSHMADLPRVAILAILSLVVPVSFLRFFFISLCLLVGVLGVYYFLDKILLNQQEEKLRHQVSFLGALFYLFNLGTLQTFVVPFEMFTVQYALLPWLFLFASLYLHSGKRKHLGFFVLTTLLAAPMAYTATLWHVYFFIFCVFLFFWIKQRKRVAILIGLTLAVNSFWLLPNLYFILSGHAALIQDAKINKIFSEEAFLHNQNHGNIFDLMIFKNFLFEWLVYNTGTDSYNYLLKNWLSFLDSRFLAIGYGASFIALWGMVKFWKNRFVQALIVPVAICVVFLLNNNPPFGFLFTFLQDKLPLFKEALRFPFTKFSLLMVFFFSCFFALGNLTILSNFKKRGLSYVYILAVTTLLIIYCWPFFQGELISKYMQVKIPQEYFQLFDWFDHQPQGLVAELPVPSFFGWVNYKWGFQGAQFISFGIKQPLLDRDYDRWDLNNEQAYRELSYAIYSQDLKLLENVIHKYQIHYFLFDKNVLASDGNQGSKGLFLGEIESLLSLAPDIHLMKQFGEISVYQTDLISGSIRTPVQFTKVTNSVRGEDVDWAYQENGDYLTPEQSGFFYPFLSLSDNQNLLNKNFDFFNNIVPGEAVLPMADYLNNEQFIPVDLYARKEGQNLIIRIAQLSSPPLFYSLPTEGKNWLVSLGNNQTLSLDLSKPDFTFQGRLFLSTNTNNNLTFYPDESVNWSQSPIQLSGQVAICSSVSVSQQAGLSVVGGNSLKMTVKNASACVRIPLSSLIDGKKLTDHGNLLHINYLVNSTDPAVEGHYCLFDRVLKRCVKEQKNLPNGEVTDFLSLTSLDSDRWEIIFYADNFGNQQTKMISYQNLMVGINQPAGVWTLTPEEIKNQFGKGVLPFNGSLLQTINGLMENQPETFQLLEQGHQSESCSNILPKNFSRSVDSSKGYIEYNAQAGSSCDYFSFPGLPHNSGYLLSVSTQNLSGLSLRVCVDNPASKRCDIFSALPKHSQFITDTIVIPPIGDGGAGFEIHFDNSSIGNIPTTNRLKELKITPIPYYWLTKLKFKIGDGSPTIASSLQITSIKHPLPQLFLVDYQNSGSNQGLIILDQSFEGGWFWSGGDHVLVNGWENGWLVKPGQSGTATIFYWPQLLEFLGLGILIGVGLVFLRKFKL